MLPKGIGAKGWGEKQHHHTQPCLATCPWDAKKSLLSLNDEPYVFLLFCNHEMRYEAQFKWSQKKVNHGKRIPSWSKARAGKPEFEGMFTSLYSKQDGGLQKFGSFSNHGIKRFNELTNEYIHAKYAEPAKAITGENLNLDPAWLKWEVDYTQRARDFLQVKDTHMEQNKAQNKKMMVEHEPMVVPMELVEV